VLDVLRNGIDSALMGLGRASVHDLVASDVLVPPGFTRALGVPSSPDA
jgi:L-lactate dehydrogenase (cytochrome)